MLRLNGQKVKAILATQDAQQQRHHVRPLHHAIHAIYHATLIVDHAQDAHYQSGASGLKVDSPLTNDKLL